MTTSCTDWNHPYYEKLKNLFFQDSVKFFMKNPSRMKDVSLGEALDFVSYGGLNYVVYDFKTKDLINFIETWMKEQRKSFLWNREEAELPKIPLINYDRCPRDEKHKKIIYDTAGRLRCTDCFEEVDFREGFTRTHPEEDAYANLVKVDFLDNKPNKPPEWCNDEEEWEKYDLQLKRYNEAELFSVRKFCYAIIREPENFNLPLETILDRINCSNKFFRGEDYIINLFSGFDLANYVHAWHNQKGKKRLFRKKDEKNFYKAFPDFKPISSDD